MAWQDYADKHVNSPVILVSIAFNSGTRYYSNDYIRTATQGYKGNILSLPQISTSVGDIVRTYERGKITLLFNDSDYEFRTLEDTETVSFKKRVVVIQVAFADDAYATPITLFTGYIYDWQRTDNLQYEFDVEDRSVNLENEYPDKLVERGDYANAHASAIGKVVPIPYGVISALGASGDGAFGHPSLTNETGLPFIDTTVDAEKHLVGRQVVAITVDRVYRNGVLQATPADYTIDSHIVDGRRHTRINWAAAERPTEDDFISCDITYGTRAPVEAMRHFLENFCGYVGGNFNAANYATARAMEDSRGYGFAGALWEQSPLRTHLDRWRDEYELDIYWNKAGEVCWNYMTGIFTSPLNHYTDLLDILDKFDSNPQVHKLMNYLGYGYDYHYSKTYFRDFDHYENADSQTEHGGTFKGKIKTFYWIRDSSVAHDIAARKVIRFKDPITFDYYPFPLKTFSDNLTDIIEISHFEGLGASGYDRRRFQIRETGYNLDLFINEMLLEDISSFIGRACILGDINVLPADWDNAVRAQRDYCYLCDIGTGEFTNGDPGKMLLD